MLREFTGDDGREWTAWDTYPSSADPNHPSALARVLGRQDVVVGSNPGALVRPTHAAGWLTFTCGRERRRLFPIPTDWTSADVPTLQGYLRRAVDMPRS